MKCFKGFVTTKDPETKKEVPFFVKVRSKDIVVTTPIKIDDYLYKTSNDYTLESEYHGHDYSQYIFKNLNDSITGGNTRVIYKLFRDGTMRIDGYSNVKNWTTLDWMEEDMVEDDPDVNKDHFYRIQLPYSITPIKKLLATSEFYRGIPIYSSSFFYEYESTPVTRKPAYCLFQINNPVDPNISAIVRAVLSQLLVHTSEPRVDHRCTVHYSITSQFNDEPIVY